MCLEFYQKVVYIPKSSHITKLWYSFHILTFVIFTLFSTCVCMFTGFTKISNQIFTKTRRIKEGQFSVTTLVRFQFCFFEPNCCKQFLNTLKDTCETERHLFIFPSHCQKFTYLMDSVVPPVYSTLPTHLSRKLHIYPWQYLISEELFFKRN